MHPVEMRKPPRLSGASLSGHVGMNDALCCATVFGVGGGVSMRRSRGEFEPQPSNRASELRQAR